MSRRERLCFYGEATAKSGMIATVKVKDTDFQKTDFLG